MTFVVEGLEDVEAWKGGAGQPIPIGDHVTEIDDVDTGVTSNNNPQVIVSWRVVDGPYRGATSREWLVVTPESLGNLKSFLEAVQYPIPPGKFRMPTVELVGRRAFTVWREDVYGGKARIKCVGHSVVPVATGGEVPIVTAGLPAPVPETDALPF